MTYVILYPERRIVSEAWVLQQAKDYLATEYLRRHPHADEAAVDANAHVRDVWEARALLEDAGLVTFGAQS